MNLTALRCSFRLSTLLLAAAGFGLAAPAFSQSSPAQASPAQASPTQASPAQGACVNQSPRQIVFNQSRQTPPAQGMDYNFTNTVPLVTRVSNLPQIMYQEHLLKLCDQHYHSPVENVQGCSNKTKDTPLAEMKEKNPVSSPPLGGWVEIHTVFARAVSTSGECASGHDHDLACCLVPPFVVVATQAKVANEDFDPPNPKDSAEWSGSRTGRDDETGCRDLPAFWHFDLTCAATITQRSLDSIGHPHFARDPQPPNRVSTDLTFVPASGTPVDPAKTCRAIRTAPIENPAAASRICPGVCRSPLNLWSGSWKNYDGYATCTCCPLTRPQ
jgi:hypothetical protein